MTKLDELRSIINTYHEVDPEYDESGWSAILCADIVVYFEGFEEPLKPNADGVLDFYHHAMALVQDEMKWALINGEGHIRKINKKAFDMIPFWVSPAGPERGIRGVNMQGGPERNGRIDKGFSFHYSVSSHLRLTLPVEYMLENPQRFADLAKAMLGRLKFATGSAGFSLNMALDGIGCDSQEGSHIYMLSRRFDGLDLGIPWDSSDYAKHGLRTINWLTFIGDGITERMNGRDAVKDALPSDIGVTELGHGLMIQAGPQPILGDVNKLEKPDDYYRVGHALRALALQLPALLDPESDEMDDYPIDIGGAENTERWYKRFFK